MLFLCAKRKDASWNDNSNEWTSSSERGVEISSPTAVDQQKHDTAETVMEPAEGNGLSLAEPKKSDAGRLVKGKLLSPVGEVNLVPIPTTKMNRNPVPPDIGCKGNSKQKRRPRLDSSSDSSISVGRNALPSIPVNPLVWMRDQQAPSLWTESDIADEHKLACLKSEVGHFFLFDNEKSFNVLIIRGCRLKFPCLRLGCENSHYPVFVENRNLHKMPQGARGCLVMYDPNEKEDTCPSKIIPGTPYKLGVVWQIEPMENRILLVAYETHKPMVCKETYNEETASDGDYCPFPFVRVPPPCVNDDDEYRWVLGNHFLPHRIEMGRHSFFLLINSTACDLMLICFRFPHRTSAVMDAINVTPKAPIV